MRFGVVTLGVVLAASLGAAVGLGAFTFGYAEGWSYFSSEPRACVNCHIMTPQFSSWVKSSHKSVATCNDCHLPHRFVPKWIAKAKNGFNHSWAFTFQRFPEPIRITPGNARILQESCLGCHGALVHSMVESMVALSGDPATGSCVHCHSDVGHGPRAGLGR